MHKVVVWLFSNSMLYSEIKVKISDRSNFENAAEKLKYFTQKWQLKLDNTAEILWKTNKMKLRKRKKTKLTTKKKKKSKEKDKRQLTISKQKHIGSWRIC